MASKKQTTSTTRNKTASVKISPKKESSIAVKKIEVVKSEKVAEGNPILSRVRFNPRKISARKLMIPLIILGLLGLGYLTFKYLVVAWVDNRPITRLQLYSQLDKRYGKDMKEQLIVQQLILSEARKRGAAVTDQDIEQEIKRIETEQGGPAQLEQILQMQGINRVELNDLVKLQLLRTKMFGQNVNISDEDVNKYLEENKESLGEAATAAPNSSESAELKKNVQDQLKQQKITEDFNSWIQNNLQSDRVKRQ